MEKVGTVLHSIILVVLLVLVNNVAVYCDVPPKFFNLLAPVPRSFTPVDNIRVIVSDVGLLKTLHRNWRAASLRPLQNFPDNRE